MQTNSSLDLKSLPDINNSDDITVGEFKQINKDDILSWISLFESREFNGKLYKLQPSYEKLDYMNYVLDSNILIGCKPSKSSDVFISKDYGNAVTVIPGIPAAKTENLLYYLYSIDKNFDKAFKSLEKRQRSRKTFFNDWVENNRKTILENGWDIRENLRSFVLVKNDITIFTEDYDDAFVIANDDYNYLDGGNSEADLLRCIKKY